MTLTHSLVTARCSLWKNIRERETQESVHCFIKSVKPCIHEGCLRINCCISNPSAENGCISFLLFNAKEFLKQETSSNTRTVVNDDNAEGGFKSPVEYTQTDVFTLRYFVVIEMGQSKNYLLIDRTQISSDALS